MIAPVLARGGAERQILATADGLLRRGYEVEIFYFNSVAGEPDFIDEFSQLGIKCHHPFELGGFIVGGDSVEDIYGLRQFAQLVDHLDIVPLGRALAKTIREFRPVEGVAPYLCLDAYRLLAQNSNIVMLNNSLAGLTKYLQWLDVPYDKIKLVYNGFLPR